VKSTTLAVAFLMITTMGARGLAADLFQGEPAIFRNPPAAVAQELRSRGCKVSDKKPRNIIQGEFFRPGQSDWAALCSTKKSTGLLVFPGGSAEGVALLNTNRKGFSKWSISVIGQERLKALRSIGGWRGPEPAEIDHQAISSFVEFGDRGGCMYCHSSQDDIHYYHKDRWLIVMTMIAN
jgi:hypothetical protein